MKIAPIEPSIFDDDDDGWQDMPIVRDDGFANGLDEEDQKKYHYKPPEKKDTTATTSNATGNLLDVDYLGDEWRAKIDQNESEYTRLRLNEEDESDEVHLRTRYLFDEDKAMTPLSQMQATKNLLTEAQRIAYVGLCALAAREMADMLKAMNNPGQKELKELKEAAKSMELWSLKIMGRLYYHMELATAGEHSTLWLFFDLGSTSLNRFNRTEDDRYPSIARHTSQGPCAFTNDHPYCCQPRIRSRRST